MPCARPQALLAPARGRRRAASGSARRRRSWSRSGSSQPQPNWHPNGRLPSLKSSYYVILARFDRSMKNIRTSHGRISGRHEHGWVPPTGSVRARAARSSPARRDRPAVGARRRASATPLQQAAQRALHGAGLDAGSWTVLDGDRHREAHLTADASWTYASGAPAPPASTVSPSSGRNLRSLQDRDGDHESGTKLTPAPAPA